MRSLVRSALIYLSRRPWLRRWVENSPVSRKLTSRFIAGSTLAEGIAAIRKLSADHMLSSLDYLGENVTSLEEAEQSTRNYLAALEEIRRTGIPTTISVKLTHLGLDLSEQVCRQNLTALLDRAASMDRHIEIDMESSKYTERTLKLILELQRNFPGRLRAVIQAYLYRSEADIKLLSEHQIPVRLCKGAYKESPAVAYSAKAQVDANYLKLMRLLLDCGTYPAIASHDPKMLAATKRYIAEQKIPPERFEFQMLFGIRRDLQRQLVREGFRVRVYVPYGRAWFPYFMRRLAERPANLFFLAKNILRS